MKIVLIGFMGSGKTTVGNYLAKKLNIECIDMDSYIEKKEGCSINEIFKTKGELYFRELEVRYFDVVMKSEANIIVSTGGGLPINIGCQKLLSENGNTIYLDTSFEIIYNRIKNSINRPLVNEGDEDILRERYECRKIVYNEIANTTVFTDDKCVSEIADIIVGMLDEK